MAKAVAVKVLKEHSFGDDGWGEQSNFFLLNERHG